MSRPRIRTIKPEIWQDEKIGTLTLPARLLFVGLMTLADDEGRFRAFPTVILGHVFPYDDQAPRKLDTWLTELANAGLIGLYAVEGMPYGAIVNFRKHQRISHPKPSIIPPPPFPTFSAESNGHHADEVRT